MKKNITNRFQLVVKLNPFPIILFTAAGETVSTTSGILLSVGYKILLKVSYRFNPYSGFLSLIMSLLISLTLDPTFYDGIGNSTVVYISESNNILD
jgi:hypothetical protein